MKIEPITADLLVDTKWPIHKLLAPWRSEANSEFLHYDSMIVSLAEKQACAQAFVRYKRANPGFDYRSRCEGDVYRFWRIS